VSLFSWTYTCVPDAVNFEEVMRTVGASAQPLRPPKETLHDLLTGALQQSDPAKAAAGQALYDRLNSGYTLARWRTPTGEESVALNRGPLVPMKTQEVPTGVATSDKNNRLWPALSMTGKDYQVFDKALGLMDVTYSSAWSLGRLMAISDSVFNAALMRFRSAIWQVASSKTRMTTNSIQPQSTVLFKSLAAVGKASDISGATFSGPVSRINVPADLPVTTSMDNPEVQETFRKEIDSAIDICSRAGSGDSAPKYNGFDGAAGNNSDWEVLLNWIHDVMYLATIPAHVLLPEPSHLQSHNPKTVPTGQTTFYPEALRFFHIDHAWIDCFLDGALSVANHLEPEYDYTRLSVKAVFNDFLGTPIGNTKRLPPVPRYGFILRSAVVKSTPDLRLTVRCWKIGEAKDGTKIWTENQDRDPLVRHTKMDDFTILSLVDCLPEEICFVKIAQPPHQQRFAIDPETNPETGVITPGRVDIPVKRLYTDATQAPPVQDPHDKVAPNDPEDALEWKEIEGGNIKGGSEYYSDATRCIKAISITGKLLDQLRAWAADPLYKGKPPFKDGFANSCVFGLEMNDPSCECPKGIIHEI
jgi:hypothetical protein